jgi:serine/threonine protein kinase
MLENKNIFENYLKDIGYKRIKATRSQSHASNIHYVIDDFENELVFKVPKENYKSVDMIESEIEIYDRLFELQGERIPALLEISSLGMMDGKEAEIPCFVMHYYPCRLHDILHKESNLGCDYEFSFENAMDWMSYTAETIALIHEKDIVHRDIKPSSIFPLDKGKTHVFDFSVSRKHDSSVSGYNLFTYPYWPYEAWGGAAKKEYDVYSFAVTFLQTALDAEQSFLGDKQPAKINNFDDALQNLGLERYDLRKKYNSAFPKQSKGFWKYKNFEEFMEFIFKSPDKSPSMREVADELLINNS